VFSSVRLVLRWCALACLLVVFQSLDAAPVSAATQFGSFGSASGQLSFPTGVAVDASGNVYIGDTQNRRADKFDPQGQFLFAWGAGVVDGSYGVPQTCTTSCLGGNGGGVGFEFPTGVAVDDNPLSPSYGDVYVVDKSHERIEKFDAEGKFVLMIGGKVDVKKTEEFEEPGNPHGITVAETDVCIASEACRGEYAEFGQERGPNGEGEFFFWSTFGSFLSVGPGGDLYVGDTARVQVFEPSGKWKETISLAGLSNTGQVTALAVDSAGDVFVNDGGVSGVHEFEPNGTEKSVQFDGGSTTVTALAVDSVGHHLFVGDSDGGFHVLEYDSTTGEPLESFGSQTIGSDTNSGIAFSGTADALYASDFRRRVTSTVWQLPVPAPGPLIVSETATPERRDAATLQADINPENGETTYRFEYVSLAQCERSGFAGATSTPDAALSASFSDQSVSASLTGLTAGETYCWRVVATNVKGTATGEVQRLEETPAAVIEGPWATDVAGESATLTAKIVNVQTASTEYRLEYGTTTSYSHVVQGTIGESEGSVIASRHIQDLEAATTYHYRVVATNLAGTVASTDHTFTTQLANAGPTLPDGRSWELVSPPNKHGALIEINENRDIQAAANGSGVTYGSNIPMLENAPASTEGFALSMRTPEGWRTEEIMPSQVLPESEIEPGALKDGNRPPLLFTPDLSRLVIEPAPLVPLSSLLPVCGGSPEATERTIYVRENRPEACYSPLVTPTNVPPNTKFGGSTGGPGGTGFTREMEFLAASRDLSHVVFTSPFALTTNAIEAEPKCGEYCQGGEQNLYEWGAGQLRLVNVLPDGKPTLNAFLGQQDGDVIHTISSDGRWVVWKVGESPEGFYVRDMVKEETVQLGRPRAVFETMSGDGSRIFFLDGGDLFEYDTATATQTDVTPQHGPGETSAGVQDMVLGASEDGAYLYFVATGVLASGASAGQNNLYIAHEESGAWKIALVATLSTEDEPDWSHFINRQYPDKVTSRVSPSGRYVAFMSDRSLTGYDNIDATSGQPDEEVYLYDAATGRLACASCNPTGERPAGVFDGLGERQVDASHAWENHWLAGSMPGWRSVQAGRAVYQPRNLSDNGRLFFDSPDALVPGDTNGTWDVYEYEPLAASAEPKSDSCTTGSDTYSERSGGCVNLISSGTSSAESVFYDASESGDDVFFATTSRLTASDYDTSYDIYDAHVCSSAAPCVTAAVSPPPCTTADSCRAAPSPQPQIFGPGPSETFSGAGNVVASPSKSIARRKSLTRARKLARELRACRKSKGGKKRTACERRARKRYGAKNSRGVGTKGRGKR
jgi:hypothetical protein